MEVLYANRKLEFCATRQFCVKCTDIRKGMSKIAHNILNDRIIERKLGACWIFLALVYWGFSFFMALLQYLKTKSLLVLPKSLLVFPKLDLIFLIRGFVLPIINLRFSCSNSF